MASILFAAVISARIDPWSKYIRIDLRSSELATVLGTDYLFKDVGVFNFNISKDK